jgi:glycerol-3-phosphate acyltransferase PlsY
MAPVLALIFPAYLLGTFPTAVVVARAGGHDVLAEGSGNPGASNVYRLMGTGPGFLVFLGDFAKGALPAAAGLVLWGHGGAYALGVAAVIGHVFPVTRRFKGGRGVATASGMLVVLYPLVTLGLAVMWFAVAYGLHRASLASLVGAAVFPVLVALTGEAGPEVAAVSALAVLVIARHAANVRRLVRGEELELHERSEGTG